MRLQSKFERCREKAQLLDTFYRQHQYQSFLKSDVGCVGKGVCKISTDQELEKKSLVARL